MLPKPETAHQFCWLFGSACIDIAHQRKWINENEYRKASKFVKTHKYPSDIQIEQWCPNPFIRIKEAGEKVTLEEMQRYWREKHFEDATPVYLAEVLLGSAPHSNKIALVKTCKNEKQFSVLNLHGYILKYGDVAYVHDKCIAEVKEK